jgi:hypothetical protein
MNAPPLMRIVSVAVGMKLDLSARIAYIYVASLMMIVATADSLIVFILSVAALNGIYGWYPQLVAQQWFIYDQLFTVFSFIGMVTGGFATALVLSERSYMGALSSAFVCAVSGAGVLVVSLIQPLALWWESILYYLLPFFAASLIGTFLIYSGGNEDKMGSGKRAESGEQTIASTILD